MKQKSTKRKMNFNSVSMYTKSYSGHDDKVLAASSYSLKDDCVDTRKVELTARFDGVQQAEKTEPNVITEEGPEAIHEELLTKLDDAQQTEKAILTTSSYNMVEDNLEFKVTDDYDEDEVDEEEPVTTNDLINIESTLVFHTEFYLTTVKDAVDVEKAGIHLPSNPHLRLGRPDVKGILSRVESLCKKEGIKRAAVLTCGPTSLLNDVSDVCIASQLSTDCSTVRFDCHKEKFEL